MAEARNGKEFWQDEIESAREQIRKGLKELAKATESAKEHGEEAWENAQSQAKEAWEEASEHGADVWAKAREQGEEVWEDAEKAIRKHPVKALGLALLAGAVLGALLLGRDRD